VSDEETSEEEALIPKIERVLRRKCTFVEKKKEEKGNALLEVSMRLSMELNHQVTTLKEMGMIDPFRMGKSAEEASHVLHAFEFENETTVYPEAMIKAYVEKKMKPPKCLFVPS